MASIALAAVPLTGHRRRRDLTVADLHEMANRPGVSNATRNRNWLRPAINVWHYAARAGRCAWQRVEKFPEEEPPTIAASYEQAATLILATEPGTPKRLLVTWLFRQGMRITHTLKLTWDKINLTAGTVKHRERKGRNIRDWVFPLHNDVLAMLRSIPEEQRVGRVFPWSDRSSVRWLGRVAAEHGFHFTPHRPGISSEQR